MEKNAHDEITAFDTLYTTNHIQMLKIVLPYFDHSIRKKLTVYIKYLELQYTLSYFKEHPNELCGCSYDKKEFNISQLCTDVLPFCTSEEKQRIEQIAGLFHTIEMYKEMSQMMEVMKSFAPDTAAGMPFDFSPEMFSSLASGGFSDISPDMLSLFSSLFSGNSNKENPESTNINDTSRNDTDQNDINQNNTGSNNADRNDANQDNIGSNNADQDNTSSNNAANSNGMMDMLMGMLSPEQKTMFEMFGGNNTHESE